MSVKTYGRIALTGGAAGSLDEYDADNLNEGDRCLTILSTGEYYFHRLSATSGAAESSPDVIKPDSGGGVSPYVGNKRWLLSETGKLNLPDTDSSNNLQLKWNENDATNRILNFKVNTGNRTLDLAEDLTILDGAAIKFYAASLASLSLPASGSVATLSKVTIDIDGGSIDGTPIGAATKATGNFSYVDIDGGVINASIATLASVDINGGNIDDTVIGASTMATGNFSYVDIDGGTLNIAIATLGTATITKLSLLGGLNVGSDADGDMYYRASSALTRLAKGAAGQVLAMNSGATASEWTSRQVGKNAIINGGMAIAQRGTSFTAATVPLNSDDTFLLDRWILLSDGNDIVDVTQQSAGGVSGNENYIRLDVETAAKKFGILQVIETKNCKNLIGKTVSLSFEAKVTDATKLSDIRAVVLAWSSTADTVTSDIVATWEAEGTRPVLVANWTAENVDASLGVTTSWVKYTISGISIDTASTTNVGVFIYQCNVAANDLAGIFLEITNVQLEYGSVATDFEYRQFGDELTKCLRYYYRIHPGSGDIIAIGQAADTNTGHFIISFPVVMRIAVTGLETSASGSFGLTNSAGNGGGAGDEFATYRTGSQYACQFSTWDAGLLVAGNATSVYSVAGAAYLGFSAEL